jgi:hypothetical protein
MRSIEELFGTAQILAIVNNSGENSTELRAGF